MLFALFNGPQAHSEDWKRTVAQHAARLGAHARFESFTATESADAVSAAWVGPEASCIEICRREGLALTSTSGRTLRRVAYTDGPVGDDFLVRLAELNEIGVAISTPSACVELIVPPATPEHLYYARDGRGVVFSNDLRLMIAWKGLELDDRGVFALLDFGLVPAPYSLAKGVRRVPGGYRVRASSRSAEPRLEPWYRVPEIFERPEADPAFSVQESLDRSLQGLEGPLVVLFSGGVDSALIAWRLSRIGRRDVTLVHYSFGDGDPDTAAARQVAAELDLEYGEIAHDPSRLSALFQRLPTDYMYPFCDLSTIPTNSLVHEILSKWPGAKTVLDGTGADAAFGHAAGLEQWNWVYSVPQPGRAALAAAYRGLGLWKRPAWRLESWSRKARRSLSLPDRLGVVLGQQSLDSIAYRIPKEIRQALLEAVREFVGGFVENSDEPTRLSFIDLSLASAGRFAAKTCAPLGNHAVRPEYPFLAAGMLQAAYGLPWFHKCRDGQGKTVLKDLLTEPLDSHLVHRPKQGFVPPVERIFATGDMRAFLLDECGEGGGPVREYLDRDWLSRALERVAERKSLARTAYNLLWTCAFTSRWLREMPGAELSRT